MAGNTAYRYLMKHPVTVLRLVADPIENWDHYSRRAYAGESARSGKDLNVPYEHEFKAGEQGSFIEALRVSWGGGEGGGGGGAG